MAYSLGPDHRNHAPELEWGGDSNAFYQNQGFDSHNVMTMSEFEATKILVDSIQDAFGSTRVWTCPKMSSLPS
jgi:hypothetical protein